MASPEIRINGVPCLSVVETGWSFTTGPEPHMQVFLVHDSKWSRIKGAMGDEITLTINNDVRVSRLILVEEVPSQKPYWRGVLVADRRWLWRRKIVLRDYNLRRKQNKLRLLGPDLVQLKAPVPKYGFAPATMKTPDQPWTAETLVEDACTILEPDNYEVDSLPIVKSGKVVEETGEEAAGLLTINDVRVRNSGNAFMGIVLNQVPGATCWMDASGTLRLFDTNDLGAAADWLKAVGPPTESGGIARLIDRKTVRPSAVHVYFAREIEMLARSREEGVQQSHTDPVDSDVSRFELTNVAPVPDPTLNLWSSGDTVVMGTILGIDELLLSWGWTGVPPLTFDLIRKLWMTGALEAIYGGAGNLLASYADGPRRIATLRTHWRSTYRIDPKVMDRMERIEATRLSIMDEVTRTRAPGTVFATYAIEYSAKGIVAQSKRKDLEVCAFQNVDAYPDVDAGETWDEYEPVASAILQVLDRELGVLRIQWASDPYGQIQRIIPGWLVRDDNASTSDVKPPASSAFRALRYQGSDPVIIGGTVAGAGGLQVSKGFKVAMIFTGVPSAPNDKRRFERVVIKPSDVEPLFASAFNVQESTGPVWELFAPPSLITARWGLVPALFDAGNYLVRLNSLLGIVDVEIPEDGEQQDANQGGGDGPPGTQGGAEGDEGGGKKQGKEAEEEPTFEAPPAPWKLLNEGHLRSWATAEAIKVYSSMADRHEGAPSVHLSTVDRSQQALKGSVVGMDLMGTPSGRILCNVKLEGAGTSRLDTMALLPQWARPEILGVVLDRQKP